MMAALMRIPPTGSTHQPFFQRVAISAITMAAVLLREHYATGQERCAITWHTSGLHGRQMAHGR